MKGHATGFMMAFIAPAAWMTVLCQSIRRRSPKEAVMSLDPFLISWVVLALVVIVLAVLRYWMGIHEDAAIHLEESEVPVVSSQARGFQKIQRIEAWGKTLTAVDVGYGLLLAGVYLYHVAVQSVQLPK